MAGPLIALAGGCSPDCRATDCVPPILIRWTEQDLPEASRVEVCVDDVCRDTKVIRNGSLVSVWASGGGQTVRVSLLATSVDGGIVADLSGRGRKHKSPCCEWIFFTVHNGVLEAAT